MIRCPSKAIKKFLSSLSWPSRWLECLEICDLVRDVGYISSLYDDDYDDDTYAAVQADNDVACDRWWRPSVPTSTKQWTRCIRPATRRYTLQLWLERTMSFSCSRPEVCLFHASLTIEPCDSLLTKNECVMQHIHIVFDIFTVNMALHCRPIGLLYNEGLLLQEIT